MNEMLIKKLFAKGLTRHTTMVDQTFNIISIVMAIKGMMGVWPMKSCTRTDRGLSVDQHTQLNIESYAKKFGYIENMIGDICYIYYRVVNHSKRNAYNYFKEN